MPGHPGRARAIDGSAGIEYSQTKYSLRGLVRSSSYDDQVLTGGTARKREWEHERTIR